MKFSVYEVGQNSSFVLFVTEFSYHMYRKNAVLNGKQKQMKPLLPFYTLLKSTLLFLLLLLSLKLTVFGSHMVKVAKTDQEVCIALILGRPANF